jgi:invasion protein IalB
MRECSKKRNRAALLVTTIGALITVQPASAQTQASNQPAAKDKDPNRIICQKIEETGSRVASKKVCMTARQWEEKRRADREYLEDAQQRSLEPNSG